MKKMKFTSVTAKIDSSCEFKQRICKIYYTKCSSIKKRTQEGAEAEEEDNPDVEARRPKLKLFPGRFQPFFRRWGCRIKKKSDRPKPEVGFFANGWLPLENIAISSSHSETIFHSNIPKPKLTSGSMCTKMVERRTPPPKHNIMPEKRTVRKLKLKS